MNPAHRIAPDHDVRMLAECAMVVALALALGSLRLLELPNGGSVSLASLPVLTLALARGWRPAAMAGLCAGLAHALAGGTIVHPVQLLLDYGLASTLLAIAALGRGRGPAATRCAVIVACTLQYAVFVASGTVFFAAGANRDAALVFSLGYNAVTYVPETVIACLLIPLTLRAWHRAGRATVPVAQGELLAPVARRAAPLRPALASTGAAPASPTALSGRPVPWGGPARTGLPGSVGRPAPTRAR